MFVRGRGSQGVVLILSVVLSAMLAMPVLMAYADADAAGRGTWANAEDETFADVGSRDEGGLEASDEPGQSDVEGEQGQTGQIEDPANPEVPEGSQDLTGPADDPANDPADPADDSAGSAGSTDDPADPAGPAGDPAGPAASPSLPENDSPDGSAYRGATLRRTPLYASPDASQPEADFLWGGVVVGGFTRWDAAGEWLAVAYGGGRYFARASDVSLNDGSGSRVAVTLSRTPAYEAPDASLPEAEFFWGGVSLSASAWDAAGEWLAVPYRGATYFVRSDALSSADSPDGSAYRGATLRRTPLYASPDASQPEADFLWGGVVVGGFTRWDAAGEWLAVAYGGGRYFARASDVSLNDGSGSRVAVTLSRTPAYEAPDASLPEAEFFWGGVSLSASAWDAAGEWLAVPYRGATYFVRSDALSSADSPDGSAYRGATLRRTPLYASPDASQPEADFLWGGVVVGGFTRWDAAGEWLAVAYGGGRYFARASDVSLNDGSGSRVAVTLSRTPAYEAPDASLPEAEFFWGGVSLSASAWDAAGEWLAVPYRGATYFVRSDALSSADSPDGSAYRGATLRRTPLYASPDASQPEADFLWGGVVVGGFTRWDAAGEWLAVAYGGGRYFARASDVSLNDGSGSRVAVTLSRTPAYEAPDASLPEAEFFWGGVSLSASAWDAAGEWLAVPYRGATYFVRSDALSSADSPDGSAYRGATLRRTPLYASPDASQPEADFLWGGVVVGGFTRWDAAGEWLAVAYGGGRYFARASDVSLNDAPGRDVPYVGRTLGRVSMRPSPDLSSEPFDFFWGGVEVPAAPWDAAGEWVLSSYRGQAAFLPADSVELVPRYYRQEGTAMYLDIEWAGQPNGYYCGPASGYMVLNHLGAHTSESGVSLTMDNLAGYMGVDSSGTDSTGFLNALNNWLGRYDYQLIASPAYDQVHSAVMDAFSTGYPTVVHTYERRGGPHYNGHGNSSMGHFMVVDGYDTATDAVYIADPWAGVWSASSQKFWYPSLREFTATYITPYRYVYFH